MCPWHVTDVAQSITERGGAYTVPEGEAEAEAEAEDMVMEEGAAVVEMEEVEDVEVSMDISVN